MPGRRFRAAVVLFLAVSAVADAQKANERETEAQKVDRYLDSLNLGELRIIHLESVLEQDPGDAATARTLADLYAVRLLAISEPTEAEALNHRIDALLKAHPEAATPMLRVMRLQGDYNRAEALVSKWIDNPEDDDSREAARTILNRITPELDEQQAQLFRDLEKEQERVDELPEGPERSRREQAVSQLAEVAGRALYFDAWSNYDLGLLQPGATAAEPLQRARAGFLKLLGVAKVDEADAAMLGSNGMARAALGAGLAAFAAGDESVAKAWFDLLHQEAVNPEIRDLADYWTVWAHLNKGQEAKVQELVNQLADSLGASATPGQEALAALLVRAGFGPKAGPDRKSLGLQGLQALARMKRYDRVRQLIERYAIPVEGRDEIVFRWVSAREKFEAAQKSRQAGDFQAAAKAFESVLAAKDAASAPDLIANTRYLLAWSRYQAGDLARAAEAFGLAAKDLQSRNDSDAPDAAWMRAVALQRLAARDASQAPAAIKALEAFRRDYPDHANAKLVAFEVLKLRGGTITVESAEQKPINDPTYGPTCLAALRHHYDQWRKGHDAAERSKVERAIAAYHKLPEASRTTEGQLEYRLVEADIALAADPSSDEAVTQLDQAASLADALPADDRLVHWYHRDRLQSAQANGDTSTARVEARWLSQHAQGTATEQFALITLARMADAALARADPADRPARLAEAHETYARLATALGESPEAIADDRNALVANARLAAYAAELGRHDEAADRYDAILKAYPKDANYLRRAGHAHFQAGHFERSLNCWQTLVNGLSDGSDGWFEAKYYQLASLAKLDRDAARQVFEQFRVLYPKLGGEAWKARFESLREGLGIP